MSRSDTTQTRNNTCTICTDTRHEPKGKDTKDATHVSKSSCHGGETVSIVVTSDAVGFDFPSDAKVQKLDRALVIDANILRFDITVNYPMPMEVFQSFCYTEGNAQALSQKLALGGHKVDIARADAADGGSTAAVLTAQRQAAGHAVQEAFPTATVARAGVTFGAAPTIIRTATGGRCAVDDEIAVAHILPHGILPFAPGLHPHVEGALDLIEDEEVSTLLVGSEGLGEGTGGNAPDLDDVIVRQGSQEFGFVGQVDGARSELVDVFHDGRAEMLDNVSTRLVAANVTVGALSVMGWVAVALDGF